jgi:predicted RND superfamily exporter protein
LEADQRILRSQTDSALASSLGMGLALALLLRSVRLAAIAMTVNIIAIGVVLGVAGWSGAALNSVTVMVAAVCLGIAIDDSVHLLAHWKEARRDGSSSADALQEALQVKARPIVGSNLVLLGVFGVLGLSSFPPVIWFGGLAVASFLAASVTVLFVLPVRCQCWYRT